MLKLEFSIKKCPHMIFIHHAETWACANTVQSTVNNNKTAKSQWFSRKKWFFITLAVFSTKISEKASNEFIVNCVDDDEVESKSLWIIFFYLIRIRFCVKFIHFQFSVCFLFFFIIFATFFFISRCRFFMFKIKKKLFICSFRNVVLFRNDALSLYNINKGNRVDLKKSLIIFASSDDNFFFQLFFVVAKEVVQQGNLQKICVKPRAILRWTATLT